MWPAELSPSVSFLIGPNRKYASSPRADPPSPRRYSAYSIAYGRNSVKAASRISNAVRSTLHVTRWALHVDVACCALRAARDVPCGVRTVLLSTSIPFHRPCTLLLYPMSTRKYLCLPESTREYP